jgi:hypothetical protein
LTSNSTINSFARISTSGVILTSQSHSKLYVEGITIKDSSGNPVRLQGFNVDERYITEEDIQWMKATGFNYIRVGFCWHRYEPMQGRYDGTFFGYLDNLLKLCKKYGIYVNLCFMQWQWSPYFTYYNGQSGVGFPKWVISPGGYSDSAEGLRDCIADFFMGSNSPHNASHGIWMREQWFRMWEYLINRYKDNPYLIAYEVFNEPTIAKDVIHVPGVYNAVMNTYVEFTERFRKIDPDTIHIYHHIGGNAERPVAYSNIVWTKSWYDVMYGGYSKVSEYAELVNRLTSLMNKYNGDIGTPFIISEMGFTITNEEKGGAEDWIRDSFNVMRQIGINNGYESYAWYIYYKGTKNGFRTPRNTDGSNTWIVPVLQQYIEAR